MSLPLDYSLSGYRFDLPEDRIAQEPAARREGSRLMVLNRSNGGRQSVMFRDILRFLPENCLLVVNNSRVVPARIQGTRQSGGAAEFLLLTPPPLLVWEKTDAPAMGAWPKAAYAGGEGAAGRTLPAGCRFDGNAANGPAQPWFQAEAEGLLRPAKKIRRGEALFFAPDFAVQLVHLGDFGRARVILYRQGDMREILERVGTLPLPPYIRRPAGKRDAERYQTTYARDDKAGSVAAPTAGLHFTPELRAAAAASGREWAEVTLYVGYGTFSPVRCEDIRRHAMHAEYVEFSQETAERLARAKAQGRPVIAVGTTSARVLEGVWAKQHEAGRALKTAEAGRGKELPLEPYAGRINIFLYPGKPFRVVDGLLTNFHLPESSLLMLVSALAGRENILAAYKQAVDEGFRFFSYGDAMLIV